MLIFFAIAGLRVHQAPGIWPVSGRFLGPILIDKIWGVELRVKDGDRRQAIMLWLALIPR